MSPSRAFRQCKVVGYSRSLHMMGRVLCIHSSIFSPGLQLSTEELILHHSFLTPDLKII